MDVMTSQTGGDLAAWKRAEASLRIDVSEWVMQTGFGPMVHRGIGESYQARGARLEQEAKCK